MNKSILTSFFAFLTFGVESALFAAKDEDKTEPVWVISWAAFFLFLGLTVFFMSMPSKRRDTTLNEEEVKEYENELARKRHALIKEEVDEFED
ncbi:MAG: hypothetical protein J6S40_03115 [Thermoguttaceae bacterium]|nr:hypothetical protein [Thermoguttaceae bacterium]